MFPGKFVVKIAGVYSTTVHVFSPGITYNAKLGIYVNRAGGGGEEKLCDAHSVVGKCDCDGYQRSGPVQYTGSLTPNWCRDYDLSRCHLVEIYRIYAEVFVLWQLDWLQSNASNFTIYGATNLG